MKINRFAMFVLAVSLGLFVANMFIGSSPAIAAPLTTFQSPPPGQEFPPVPPVDLAGIEGWLAVLGILPIMPLIVQLLKRFKWVPDGSSANWTAYGNIVLFVLMATLGVFGIDTSGDTAKDIYEMLIQSVKLLVMVFGSPTTYKLAKLLGVVKPKEPKLDFELPASLAAHERK